LIQIKKGFIGYFIFAFYSISLGFYTIRLMKYFKLNPNVTSKKWKGIINPGDLLHKNKVLDDIELSEKREEITLSPLHYAILTDGKISPVNTIGADFLVFDELIKGLEVLNTSGVQYLPLLNKKLKHHYILMHIYNHIDCVDWTSSDYEVWPEGHNIQEWQNPRGRLFFKPVLVEDKIPEGLDMFRLQEWGGAFNIIISERFKQTILSLDFDHSFLEFHPLTLS
jgi:hypothetical protein